MLKLTWLQMTLPCVVQWKDYLCVSPRVYVWYSTIHLQHGNFFQQCPKQIYKNCEGETKHVWQNVAVDTAFKMLITVDPSPSTHFNCDKWSKYCYVWNYVFSMPAYTLRNFPLLFNGVCINYTPTHSPKRKWHFDEIVTTGCTWSCHFDSFQCSQVWTLNRTTSDCPNKWWRSPLWIYVHVCASPPGFQKI